MGTNIQYVAHCSCKISAQCLIQVQTALELELLGLGTVSELSAIKPSISISRPTYSIAEFCSFSPIWDRSGRTCPFWLILQLSTNVAPCTGVFTSCSPLLFLLHPRWRLHSLGNARSQYFHTESWKRMRHILPRGALTKLRLASTNEKKPSSRSSH